MKISKRILAILLTLTLAVGLLYSFTDTASVSASSDKPIVVTLGDSHSSGEGIEPFYGQEKKTADKVKDEDWLAHRSTLAWAGQLKIKGVSGTLAENKDVNWFFVAASGAEVKDLTSKQEKIYNKDNISGKKKLTAQLDIFDKLEKGSVDYVTISIGGNDIGFVEIISDAITLSEDDLKAELDKKWTEFFAKGGTRESIKNAYKTIAEKAGSQANIIVTGYPKLLNPEGFKVKVIFTISVSPEKVAIINEATSLFNDELEKLVKECRDEGLNIYFADIEKEFEGHEAYTEDPYLNEIYMDSMPEDIDEEKLVSGYSLHPNTEGAKAYTKVVQKIIDEIEGAGTSSPVVTVTASAINKAKLSMSVYLGGAALNGKAFKVNGKVNGKKKSVIYVPAKELIEAAGGKYVQKDKKVTITLGTVKLTFKQGKNSYTLSYRNPSTGKTEKTTLQLGRAALKDGLIYIPGDLIEAVSKAMGTPIKTTSTKTKVKFEF